MRIGLRLGAATAALLILAAAPASAHKLKIFATLEDGTVAGYAFFVGGRRPAQAFVRAVGPDGAVIHEAAAGPEGAFAFPAPEFGPIEISVNAGEGHVASMSLGAARTGTLDPTPDPSAPTPSQVPTAAIEAAVEAAVARQLRPLLEAQAEAEARIRFNDLAGGVGMIVGMAGAALWARSRR